MNIIEVIYFFFFLFLKRIIEIARIILYTLQLRISANVKCQNAQECHFTQDSWWVDFIPTIRIFFAWWYCEFLGIVGSFLCVLVFLCMKWSLKWCAKRQIMGYQLSMSSRCSIWGPTCIKTRQRAAMCIRRRCVTWHWHSDTAWRVWTRETYRQHAWDKTGVAILISSVVALCSQKGSTVTLHVERYGAEGCRGCWACWADWCCSPIWFRMLW